MQLKTFHNLALASLAIAPIFNSAAATFDDIQLWAGSGANRAALVIDWNDGKSAESLLWGYRWDGTATGLNMLEAVVNADSRLFARFGSYNWGTTVLGLGYDLNQSGSFAVTPSLAFDSRGLVVDANPDDARIAADAADHWLEGWNSGFWAYYLRPSTESAWESALLGAADRPLTDGVWDGYSFAPGFVGPEPGEPSPAMVPEPGSLALLAVGGLFLKCLRRNQLR